MKGNLKYIFSFIFFSILILTIHGQTVFSDQILKETIKTVELYPENNPMGESVLFLNEQNLLVLKFDEIDSDYIAYAYTLVHCDAQWEMSDLLPNEYIEGYTEAFIVDYQFSNNTKVPFVHYSLKIPNNDIQFRYSGNYVLLVYPEGEPDIPVFSKKFYVVDQLCTIGGDILAPSNPEIRHQGQEIVSK